METTLAQLRDRAARLVTIEDRPAQMNDTVNINFEGFADGVAFEGGKGEGVDLVLGSGHFIPGFEEQIVGHSTGDSFRVTVTSPRSIMLLIWLASRLYQDQHQLHQGEAAA